MSKNDEEQASFVLTYYRDAMAHWSPEQQRGGRGTEKNKTLAVRPGSH
jgi:hypothetical protein